MSVDYSCVVAGRTAESCRRVSGSNGSSRSRCWPSWSQPALPHQDQTPPGVSLPGTQQAAGAQICASVLTCVVGVKPANILMSLVPYRTHLCWRVTTGDPLWECCESQDCCPICLLTCRKHTQKHTPQPEPYKNFKADIGILNWRNMT